MKVLVIQDSLSPIGGSEIVAMQGLEAVAQAGWASVAVCRERARSPLLGMSVHEVPELFRLHPSPDLGPLGRIMDEERPDLVHIHKVGSADVIRFVARRTPTIVTVHDHAAYCPGGSKVFWRTGTLCTRPLGFPCLLHAYADRCATRHPVRLWRHFAFSTNAMSALQQVGRVLTLTAYVREQLVRSGLDGEGVSVLAPWVDIPSAHPMAGQADLVLFVGRIVREKGLPVLLTALKLVKTAFRVVVAGDGPLRGRCEELVSKLGLQQAVEFRGWLDTAHIKREYAESAFVVVPSIWPEPFGMVGVEAMAHGRPVVAFDVGGVRDWLEDGVNGLLVRKGDTVGLAGAIEQLLRDRALRARLGSAARDRVTQRYGRKQNAGRLLASYRELVNWTMTRSSSGRRE